MKERLHIFTHLIAACAMFFIMAGAIPIQAEAASYTAGTAVNLASGECRYNVQGLDVTQTSSLTLQVSHKNTQNVALQTTVALTSDNCSDGTYNGSFSLEDLNFDYDAYEVHILVGDSKVSAGLCDFSIHADKLSIQMDGGSDSASRNVSIASSEAAGEAAIPGQNKFVSVMAWPQGSDEKSAQVIAAKTPFTEGGMRLSANVGAAGTAYGVWNAKLVFVNDKTGTTQSLASTTYTVIPSLKTFEMKRSKSLEKKKAFGITLDGLSNVYGVQKVTFSLYNSKGKKAASIAGTKKRSNGSKFYAEVKLKKLNYVLDRYTIRATLTDNNGKTYTLNDTALADEQAQNGTLTVKKTGNASCIYKLNNAYIPGNIKKMRFNVYQMKGKNRKKTGTYYVKGTAGKRSVSLKTKNTSKGEFLVEVYGYTSWGKKVFLNEKTYELRKKDMGKNGWYYEKYNGKTYKFYYINNVKQTDLTNIINLKESSSSNTNRLYIEVNRAACAVTIYLYNNETKKYDIPIKTCAVSVGRDVSTNAGTSALHLHSSYTPLGTYSICTNGTSVKYTLKPMHEPDGSTVFARWTSHIVGNIYFHSIAVSTDSHYALPSYRYNLLGSPASAGCIRMTVADAKWIYDYASTGTPVKIVKGDTSKPGPLGKPAVIKTTGSINYDPTDPEVPDSRKKADYKAKKITGYMTKKGKRVGY